MKVTQKEIVSYITSIQKKIDNIRLIDLLAGKVTISGLKYELNEAFEMVNYCLNHPLRSFEDTLSIDCALSWIEKDLRADLEQLERKYKAIKSKPFKCEPENNFI